jgi:hypothetical protein
MALLMCNISTLEGDSMMTEDEIRWLKLVLGEDYEYDPLKLPAHYVRLKKAKYERNANKEVVRKNKNIYSPRVA